MSAKVAWCEIYVFYPQILLLRDSEHQVLENFGFYLLELNLKKFERE